MRRRLSLLGAGLALTLPTVAFGQPVPAPDVRPGTPPPASTPQPTPDPTPAPTTTPQPEPNPTPPSSSSQPDTTPAAPVKPKPKPVLQPPPKPALVASQGAGDEPPLGTGGAGVEKVQYAGPDLLAITPKAERSALSRAIVDLLIAMLLTGVAFAAIAGRERFGKGGRPRRPRRPSIPLGVLMLVGSGLVLASPAFADLNATPAGTSQINLSWTPSTGNAFVITAASGGASPAPCGDSSQSVFDDVTSSFAHVGLTPNTTYTYRGCYYDPVNLIYFNEATATAKTAALTPPAPAGFNAQAGATFVRLSWSAPTGGNSIYIVRVAGTTPLANCGAGGTAIPLPGSGTTTDDQTGSGPFSYTACLLNPDGVQGPSVSKTVLAFKPPLVQNLKAVAGDKKVVLTWNAIPTSPAGMKIVIRRNKTTPPASCADGTQIYKNAGTTFTDAGLANGSVYHYIACLVGPQLQVGDPVKTSATPVAPPAAPGGFTATSGDTEVKLSWQALPAGIGIVIRRRATTAPANCLDPNAAQVTAPAGSSSVVDTGLKNGTVYLYVACAISGTGVLSTPVKAEGRPQPAPPVQAPSPVALFVAQAGNGQVTLSWQPLTAGQRILVRRGVGMVPSSCTDEAATLLQIPDGASSFVDAGLQNGSVVTYVACAFDGARTSTPVTAAATPAVGDDVAPHRVAKLRARITIRRGVVLTFVKPADADFSRVRIVRSWARRPRKPADGIRIYEGPATTVALDFPFSGGKRVFYGVFAIDNSGNLSRVALTSVKRGPGTIPLKNSVNATVSGKPAFRWHPVPRVDYYNIQLWKGQFGKPGAQKLETHFPTKARFRLGRRLARGTYSWYVFAHRGGGFLSKPVGASTFIVPR